MSRMPQQRRKVRFNMKLDELINKVDDIAVNSGALATLDFFELAQMFFKQDNVKKNILDLNRDRLYVESTNNNGLYLPPYAEKTAKHKRRVGLPDRRYTYYETGATHESLDLYVEDEFAMVTLGVDAPEYAFLLDESAWGITDEQYDEEVRDTLLEFVQDKLKDYLTNG